MHGCCCSCPRKRTNTQNPFVSTPVKQSTKQGNARGTSEVRRRISSIHFHCLVSRSSSHIGHGFSCGHFGTVEPCYWRRKEHPRNPQTAEQISDLLKNIEIETLHGRKRRAFTEVSLLTVLCHIVFRTGKRGHYERGLFTRGTSRIESLENSQIN